MNFRNLRKRQNTHHPQFCTRDVDRQFCGGGVWISGPEKTRNLESQKLKERSQLALFQSVGVVKMVLFCKQYFCQGDTCYFSSKAKGPGEEGDPRNHPEILSQKVADFPMTPLERTEHHFGPF